MLSMRVYIGSTALYVPVQAIFSSLLIIDFGSPVIFYVVTKIKYFFFIACLLRYLEFQ